MGWIVKLGRRNMFGDDVFPTRAGAKHAIVCAIRGGSSKEAERYIDASVPKTKNRQM